MILEMESALPGVIAATKGQTPKAELILKNTVERFKRDCSWQAMEKIYINAYAERMSENDLRLAVLFFESEGGKNYILGIKDADKTVYDNMKHSLVAIFADEQN